MYIAGRERKVIELLIKYPEGITVKELGAELEVSTRTIHRDLKNSEKTLFDYNLELAKKAGVGVRIIGDSQDLQQLEMALTKMPSLEFTPNERQAVILSALLETNEPIKLYALASELGVTVATISHDLDELEEPLTSHHLFLIRKRGFGVKVEGEERNKRAAISNLISKYVDPFEFVSLIKENIQKKSKPQLNSISNRLLGLVNPEKLVLIEQKVEQTRTHLQHELADSAHVGLVVHLALAIERLQKGDTIEFDPVYLKQMEETHEYAIAKKLIQDLEMAFDMEIPEDEIGYITMHLLGAKLRSDHHFMLEDSSMDVAYQAKALIQYISTQLDTDLTDNTALLNDLVTHLKPTIYRLKQGMNIKNPMIDEITRDYADLFYLIEQGARDIFPDVALPKDEIGYLVLHFASVLLHGEKDADLHALVICSSGIGTAKILATKLMQRFPEVKQVDNKSLFDLGDSDTGAYDIIVSTIPLKGLDEEYVVTSPMLTKDEVERIKKAIRKKKLTYKPNEAKHDRDEEQNTDFILQLEAMQHYSKVILDVLNAFYMEEMAAKQNVAAILRSVCMQLEKSQMIEDRDTVFRELQNREQVSGLGIPGTSLALYHTRSAHVFVPSFTIHALNESLIVAGMDGEDMTMNRMLLMLAPEDAHPEMLEVLSYLSSIVIQGKESIKRFESGDEAKIKNFLTDQFYSFLNEKKLIH
nr:BglG family transcription antiterminator [Virgibacillus natechei]